MSSPIIHFKDIPDDDDEQALADSCCFIIEHTESLQVIPEEEELDLNLAKSNAPR